MLTSLQKQIITDSKSLGYDFDVSDCVLKRNGQQATYAIEALSDLIEEAGYSYGFVIEILQKGHDFQVIC